MQITVAYARYIIVDLDRNIAFYVDELQKYPVTADLLKTVELEKALSRHVHHPDHHREIQSLLRHFQAILKEDDKIKEEELKKDQKMKESNRLRLKVLRRNQRRVRRAIEDADEVVTKQSAKIAKIAMKCVTNVTRSTGTKRKCDDSTVELEPEAKILKVGNAKEMLEISENAKSVNDLKDDSDEDEDAPKLIEKIEDLPLLPTATEIARCLEGVTSSDLMTVEKYMGWKMKSLDEFWWSLCERDLNVTRSPSSTSDPREVYAKHIMSQNFDSLFSKNHC